MSNAKRKLQDPVQIVKPRSVAGLLLARDREAESADRLLDSSVLDHPLLIVRLQNAALYDVAASICHAINEASRGGE